MPRQALEIVGVGFAVEPITNCPHEKSKPPAGYNWVDVKDMFQKGCLHCSDPSENWVCLVCSKILCSRYVNGHMAQHAEASVECDYALSLADLSVWCFRCDSYITSPTLERLQRVFSELKFSDESESGGEPSGSAKTVSEAQGGKSEEKGGDENPGNVEGNSESVVSREPALEEFARKLAEGKYRNIIVVSGAGISTSSGIPDFRSENGLYAILDTYDVGVDFDDPTQIFSIEFFRNNPRPFYLLSKKLFYATEEPFKPTPCHYFLRLLQDKGLLRRIYTQNIDGLECRAGLRPDLVVQCHGGDRTAHCINPACSEPYSMDELRDAVRADRIVTCPACGALVKPDVVFFGESLPSSFSDALKEDISSFREYMEDREIYGERNEEGEITEGGKRTSTRDKGKEAASSHPDLVIVMGTSLMVAPVKFIPDMLSPLPRALFNRELVGTFDPDDDVCVLGDIDEGVRRVAALAGWGDQLDALIDEGKRTK